MESSAASVFAHWESFYVIVGSSAGGLTGLMFIVITLVAESSIRRNTQSINAFGTPNVIHFLAVLVIAAILSAPWHGTKNPAHLIGVCGLAGIVYVLIVLRRVRRQSAYQPVLEDWVWHLILPLLAYATLFVGAAGLAHEQPWALFLIGGVAMLLLFIGIHNAWDTVTYVALTQMEGSDKPPPASGS